MINRRFRLIKVLGRGRSIVYLCEDIESANKKIALKVLSKNATLEEQGIFKKEYEIIQNLDHPSIIQAYERGTIIEANENESVEVGSKFLAMEYFDGEELKDDLIADESGLKEVITQICSVLFYLHQSNYIYYDLKTENILIRNSDGQISIKLIDLGFAKLRNNNKDGSIAGTAEYIAPELLNKEPHDHRVDLYALGILLYKLVYKRFPFPNNNQLEIYKAHVEKEFEFPAARFNSEIVNVIKKLLSKNPNDRYYFSYQVLYDLNIPLSEEIYQYWVPVKTFSDRLDILNIVNRYVTTPTTSEVIAIRGFEKSGKSEICRKLYSIYANSIFIQNDRTRSGIQLIKSFLNRLLFNDIVFNKLHHETLELYGKILSDSSKDLVNDVKLIVNKVTQIDKIILIIDDLNLYDSFVLRIFEEIFPIFQVNGCYLIVTEKSDHNYVSGFLNNLTDLNITSFTASQTEEMLDALFAEFFPVNAVKQLVMRYADFLPGNISEFLRNIVYLQIIRFNYDKIETISDENSQKVLSNLFNEIYNIRYNSLSSDEIKIAKLVSSFEVVPDLNYLIKLTGLSEHDFLRNVDELKRKDIFLSHSQTGLIFSSEGIKNFIYAQIPDKKHFHKKIAVTIGDEQWNFSKVEQARHYEIAEEFNESYSLLLSEIREAEKISALKYKLELLEKLLKLPINNVQEHEVKTQLCLLYSVLNDHKNAFQLAQELLNNEMDESEKRELMIVKGNSMIRLGEVEDGLEILKVIVPLINDNNKRARLLLDIAWGELDLNNFKTADEIANRIINDPELLPEYKGDAYNLSGFISINFNHDLETALSHFNKCMLEYQKANSIQRMAAIEGNIGNIFNMKEEYEEVEKHWNKSLELSTSLGNLSYQALLLMNFGIYHFNSQSFEESINKYKRAALIFSTIGEKIEYAKSEANLGETYLFICQYQNGIQSLENSRETLKKLSNQIEKSESLFLLAKLYFRIGHFKNFNKIYQELNKILEEESISERPAAHVKYLSCLQAFINNEKTNCNLLIDLADVYYAQEDRINYFEVMVFLIEYYLNNNELEEAFKKLSDKNFEQVCQSNVYMEIEKLYLMGKLSRLNKAYYAESSIFYFDKAFNLMSDLNINETMTKILFELSTYYSERGNFVKAKEFSSYGMALIDHLAQQFLDEGMREMYLSSSHRANAMMIFDEIISNN
ncbi:MAG: serine/threonine-protein kinase [Ignavibacteriaceae bacterium]|nr:serine/threonine-protein kinase [Ignavibacteriaceae bacterium]